MTMDHPVKVVVVDVVDLERHGPPVHPARQLTERRRPEVGGTGCGVVAGRDDLRLGVAGEDDPSHPLLADELPALVGVEVLEGPCGRSPRG